MCSSTHVPINAKVLHRRVAKNRKGQATLGVKDDQDPVAFLSTARRGREQALLFFNFLIPLHSSATAKLSNSCSQHETHGVLDLNPAFFVFSASNPDTFRNQTRVHTTGSGSRRIVTPTGSRGHASGTSGTQTTTSTGRGGDVPPREGWPKVPTLQKQVLRTLSG